jgi:hypothetical protein
MKRVISIAFVALFLLNSFGYYIIFSYDHLILKDKMRQLIHSGYFNGDAVVLTIINPATNPDFKWVDKGEFRYKGKLYDVISQQRSGTSLIFRCINDSKEEDLIVRTNHLHELFSGMNSAKQKNSVAFHKLLIKQALLKHYSFSVPENYFQIIFSYPSCKVKSILLSPSSPPPKTA